MRQIIYLLAFLFVPGILLGQVNVKVKEGDKTKISFENGEWFFMKNLSDGHYAIVKNDDTSFVTMDISIKNGKKHGKESRYSFDGKKYTEINWLNGKKNGKEIQYNEDGTINYLVTFRNDVLDGPFIRNGSFGEKQYEGFYNNGIRDSIWIYYDGDPDRFDSANYWLFQTYKYINGLPRLTSAWNKMGIQGVIRGNGIIIDSGYTTTITHYADGLRNGFEIQLKPNGDTVSVRKYMDDVLVYEKQFSDLDMTSDSASYVTVITKGSSDLRYPAHSYLNAISEWEPSGELQTDTLMDWLDEGITNIFYKKIIRKNGVQKSGFWAVYFQNGIPAIEGKYLRGNRTGEWRWKYPNGFDRLRINYDKNDWHHIDTNGNIVSGLKYEYLSALASDRWSGGSFLKELGTKEIKLKNYHNLEDAQGLQFFLDGKVRLLDYGDSDYSDIGKYYILANVITLNILDKTYVYGISFNQKGYLILQKVK